MKNMQLIVHGEEGNQIVLVFKEEQDKSAETQVLESLMRSYEERIRTRCAAESFEPSVG